MATWTPASMAVDSPPLHAEMLENLYVLKPTCVRQEMIMAEISGDVA